MQRGRGKEGEKGLVNGQRRREREREGGRRVSGRHSGRVVA